MEVTTTSTRVGKFEARFYHLVFEEEFARVSPAHLMLRKILHGFTKMILILYLFV